MTTASILALVGGEPRGQKNLKQILVSHNKFLEEELCWSESHLVPTRAEAAEEECSTDRQTTRMMLDSSR
jgi:hypothetical protein